MGKIIAVSGVAGSGKDTLALLLERELRSFGFSTQRISLAEPLKYELRDFCVEKYGIDPVLCSRAEKNFIRPLLVEHARLMRLMSWNTHYWKILEDKIDYIYSDVEYIIVPDLRFYENETDEVSWVKNRDGRIIHVSRWLNNKDEYGLSSRTYLDAPNSTEAFNDPRVKEVSDYQLHWETLEGEDIYKLSGYAQKVIQWMIDTKFIPEEDIAKITHEIKGAKNERA